MGEGGERPDPETVRRMAAERKSDFEIAAAMRVRVGVVTECRLANGIPSGRSAVPVTEIDPDEVRQLVSEGMVAARIADVLGCSWGRVANDQRGHGISPSLYEEVRRLVADGLSSKEIAQKLGAKWRQVVRCRQELGIRGRGKPGSRPRIPPARLRELIASGLHDAQIAAETGYAASTVAMYRRRLGVRNPPRPDIDIDPDTIRPMIAAGKTVGQIAVALNCSCQSVRRCDRQHKLFDESKKPTLDLARLLELTATGLTTAQIAAEMGTTKSVVLRHRRRFGVPSALPAGHMPEDVRESVRLKHLQTKRRHREQRAAAFGLPEWVDSDQLRVLLILAGGPQTLRSFKSRVGGSCRMQELIDGGLVSVVRPADVGRNGLSKVAMLTLKAMNMLASAGEEASGVEE